MAGTGRVNQALTGNLLQPSCTGRYAVTESCYTVVYCSYNDAEFRG